MFEDKLLAVLRERQDEVSIALAEYPQEDYPKYMKQVGIYQGLGIALSELTHLLSDDDSE